MERSRKVRLVARPMVGGIAPESLLNARSSLTRFGKEDKSKFSRVPLSPLDDKFRCVTLPFVLQIIQSHLHGLGVGGVELVYSGGKATQDSRADCFGRLAFHLSRAFVSVFETVSALYVGAVRKS